MTGITAVSAPVAVGAQEAVRFAQRKLGYSERRVCRALDVARSTIRYKPKVAAFTKRLLSKILELVRRFPRYGYKRITAILRREGWRVNRKRVHRLWKQEGLRVPQRARKRRRLGHSANACHRRRATHDCLHVLMADAPQLFDLSRLVQRSSVLEPLHILIDQVSFDAVALEAEQRC